jgi:hypothetical protein
MAVGDFNGDGRLDLAVSANNTVEPNSFVSVLRGNGDGTFQPPLVTNVAEPHCGSVIAADLSGDGKLDLVLSCGGAGVLVLPGNGDSTFKPAVTYSWGYQPGISTVAVADFDGDGKLDLVAVGQSLGASVLLGKGDGTFREPVTFLVANGCNYGSVVTADFNRDGKPDVAVLYGYPATDVSVLTNTTR